jgi:hypothetical protein
MHMLAYPAWCAALLHGLYAGREAKPVFVILYGLSLVAVIAALALRSAPRAVKREVADRITALLGTEDRPGREEPAGSRDRAEDAALPGFGRDAGTGHRAGRRRKAGFDRQAAAGAQAPAERAGGFAAAYRAVSRRPRAPQSFTADETARMDLPDFRSTQSLPLTDSGSSTSGAWPIPSPPPVGEAPPSAYDPLTDTGYTVPIYSNPGTETYGSSDVYDIGESNAPYGTYNPSDTYNSGPATEPFPGASYDYEAPGSGEPWNTPSGGFK